MRGKRGDEQTGLHIKDKFLDDVKEMKMDFWGITMRESDYGLDLLSAIANSRLKDVDFPLST